MLTNTQFTWVLQGSSWLWICIRAVSMTYLLLIPGYKKIRESYQNYSKYCKYDPHFKQIRMVHFVYLMVLLNQFVYQLIIQLNVILYMMLFFTNLGVLLQMQLLYYRIIEIKKMVNHQKALMTEKRDICKFRILNLLFFIAFVVVFLPYKGYGLLYCNVYATSGIQRYGFFYLMFVIVCNTLMSRKILKNPELNMDANAINHHMKQPHHRGTYFTIKDVQLLDAQKKMYQKLQSCMLCLQVIMFLMIWWIVDKVDDGQKYNPGAYCNFYNLQESFTGSWRSQALLQGMQFSLAMVPYAKFILIFYKVPCDYDYFVESERRMKKMEKQNEMGSYETTL